MGGCVVGTASNGAAWVWDPTHGIRTLTGLGDASRITDRGWILGLNSNGTALWRVRRLRHPIHLAGLIKDTHGWTFVGAFDINERLQIGGIAERNGEQRTVLLIPQ
jgi:hypothetical protein